MNNVSESEQIAFTVQRNCSFFFSNVMVLIYECGTKHRPLYWHLVPLYGFPHTQAPFSIGNPLHSSDAEAPVNHKDTIINIFIIMCCFYSITVQLIKRYVISIYRKFIFQILFINFIVCDALSLNFKICLSLSKHLYHWQC